ncbi:MAG: S-layer homology domain-containing protein [Candidatus Peribacteraceae bacterium]|nr:S-layer homology domain-containing protein [Candidatus Peribacteraceae bacterium]
MFFSFMLALALSIPVFSVSAAAPEGETIPDSWTYVVLGDFPFEIPLPKPFRLEEVGNDALFIESGEYSTDGTTATIDPNYFFFFFQKISTATSVDQYLAHLCYLPDGSSDNKVIAASGDEFPLEYTLADTFIANGIYLTPIHTNCRGLFPYYVMQYQDQVYHFALMDIGYGSDATLYNLAIANIRPVQKSNTPAIQYLLDNGIASGYPDGTFRPNDRINRAEFTKIIVGAVGLSTEGLCKMASFSDVMGTEWYGPFSQAARCAGIIGGYPDGTFRPARNINTAEAAKIVVEAFNLLAPHTDMPTDLPYEEAMYRCDEGEWYACYIQSLQDIDALPPSAQDPAHLLTRGEMAEIIYRVMTRVK